MQTTDCSIIMISALGRAVTAKMGKKGETKMKIKKKLIPNHKNFSLNFRGKR